MFHQLVEVQLQNTTLIFIFTVPGVEVRVFKWRGASGETAMQK